jgi:hypothetical protein
MRRAPALATSTRVIEPSHVDAARRKPLRLILQRRPEVCGRLIDVEGLLAHHRLEALVGRRLISEIGRDRSGFDRSILQRGGAGMVAKQGTLAASSPQSDSGLST